MTITTTDEILDGSEQSCDGPASLYYPATMPVLGDTPEGSGFRRTPGIGDPEDDPADRNRRRSTGILDMVTSGHGFMVQTLGSTKVAPNRCRYCQAKITVPGEAWVCEFSGDVQARPIVRGAEECCCNACEWNSDARSAGRPAEVCSINPQCQRQRKRDKAKAYRDRRKAEALATA